MYSSSIQARNHSTIGGSEVTTLLCDGEKRELSSTTVTTSVHEFFYWLDPRRKYPDISFSTVLRTRDVMENQYWVRCHWIFHPPGYFLHGDIFS